MKAQIFLLMQLLHLAVSLKTDCPHECITLDKCPGLVALIQTNVRVVQEATCSVQSQMPRVCCPKATGPTPKPPTPTPRTPTTNLLPKECGLVPLDGKIHGGNRTRLGSYPWMAAIGYRKTSTNEIEFRCGGSVISERYVLSAAHCFIDEQPEVIRLGDWDLASELDCETTDTGFQFCAPQPAQDLLYEEIIMHPDYNTRSKVSDDIALIRLAEPIDFRRNKWIQPVCLPERDFDVRAAVEVSSAIVTGWGYTETGSTSDILLQVALPMMEMPACNLTYSGRLVDEQVCFGGVFGKDSCSMDSGGPLVVARRSSLHADPFMPISSLFTQIGIVSFGPLDCGRKGKPGVYTGVTSYRDWIEQNMKQ